MEMMVRQRMRQAGKRSKKAPEKPVSVSCTLTAQWKLQGKTSETLLLETQAIEDKVRAADLPGKNSEEIGRRRRTCRGNRRRNDGVR